MNQGWAQDLIKNDLYTTTQIRILTPHMYYMDPPKLRVKIDSSETLKRYMFSLLVRAKN